MTKYWLVILVMFLFGCSPKTESTKFKAYYDDAHTKLSMEGSLNKNSNEEGLWKIYNKEGIIEEQGRFKNGLHVGEWTYKLDNYIPDTVQWVLNQTNDFKFSLPGKSFYNACTDSNWVCFIDSNDGYVVTIRKYDKNKKFSDAEKLIKYELHPLILSNNYQYFKHEKVICTRLNYDLIKLTVKDPRSKIKATTWSIIIDDEDYIFRFSVISDEENSLTSRFYLAKIVLHSLFKGKRIMHPLNNIIKEIIIKDELKNY